jgi:hypothetical protein
MEKQINGGYQMVSSRLRTTIVFFALCGLIATSAFAGNLSSGLSTTFAHEIATSTTDLTFANQIYYMGIARNAGQNFILRFTLSNATFGSTVIPTNVNLTYGGAAVGVQIVQRSGGNGMNVVEYDINLTGPTATGGTLVNDAFTFSGTVRFAASSAVGTTTTLTADARDVISALDTVATNFPVGQTGAYARTLATLAGAASLTATTQPRATIDATVAVPLTLFVAQSTASADDDTTTVAKAFVNLADGTSGVKTTNGTTDYALVPADLVTFTINGDFTNIASVGIDLDSPPNGITAPTGATTTTAETFTINASLTSATLTVDGNRIGPIGGILRAVWFTKVAGATLNPRTFTISATVNPTVASGRSTQNRTIGTSASDWFVWVQNGTVIVAPYVSFTPGNGVKFRFVNSASTVVNVLVSVVLDQGTFTQAVTTFPIPANGSQQITFSDLPAAGTGELGPIASALLSGTAPVRGKVTFTVLTASSNVAGVELIYSPVGVVTLVNLPQQGIAGWER